MTKWTVLGAGMILQTILGGVYAWSAFVPSLSGRHALTQAQCGMIFGLAIAVFAVAMVPAGRLLPRVGARPLAAVGACLFAAGYLVASFSDGRFPLLLLGIGVIAGTGIGAAYVCPLAICMQWFPRHKGLVTGLAVAGFGGGAVLLSLVANRLLYRAGWDVLQVFRGVGVAGGAVALAAALLLRAPAPSEAAAAAGRNRPRPTLGRHALSTPFLMLCVGMFSGTFAGLLTVGNLKPYILRAGQSADLAALSISLFAFGNAAGRILWGQVHDRLASRTTILLSLALLAAALVPLLFPLPVGVMLVAIACCGCGFGACFVVYAAAVVQRFGMELFPRLYPLCFLGYGLAGLVAPGLGGRMADATGSYVAAVALCIATLVGAMLVIAVASSAADPPCGAPRNAAAHGVES